MFVESTPVDAGPGTSWRKRVGQVPGEKKDSLYQFQKVERQNSNKFEQFQKSCRSDYSFLFPAMLYQAGKLCKEK